MLRCVVVHCFVFALLSFFPLVRFIYSWFCRVALPCVVMSCLSPCYGSFPLVPSTHSPLASVAFCCAALSIFTPGLACIPSCSLCPLSSRLYWHTDISEATCHTVWGSWSGAVLRPVVLWCGGFCRDLCSVLFFSFFLIFSLVCMKERGSNRKRNRR